MVASVLDDKVVNHLILTFIGEQVTYKSSFMLNILPPHLRNYYATKNNSYQLNKDDYLMLAENIIISLEEIDSMTTEENAFWLNHTQTKYDKMNIRLKKTRYK